jgi:hypothetical protein
MKTLLVSAIAAIGAIGFGGFANAHEPASVRTVTESRYVGTYVRSDHRHARRHESVISPIALGIAIGYPLILHDHRVHQRHRSYYGSTYGHDNYRSHYKRDARHHQKHGSKRRSKSDRHDRHDRKHGHRGWR